MSSKADLARIGKEGFDILEAFHSKKAKAIAQKPYVPQEHKQAHLYQYQPCQVYVYQAKPDEIMNCHEVLQFQDGLIIKDFTKRSQVWQFHDGSIIKDFY